MPLQIRVSQLAHDHAQNLRQGPLYNRIRQCLNKICMLIPVENWRNTGRAGLVFVPLMSDFQYLDLTIGQVQLDLFPTLEFDDVVESELFPWGSVPDVECIPLKPHTVKAWDRAWAALRIFTDWKLENREGREQSCQICQTILAFLLRPVFPFHLVSKERSWSLLHGAHPPRHNAGIPTPAFALS
jgi:hypothetical protein